MKSQQHLRRLHANLLELQGRILTARKDGHKSKMKRLQREQEVLEKEIASEKNELEAQQRMQQKVDQTDPTPTLSQTPTLTSRTERRRGESGAIATPGQGPGAGEL